MLTILGLLTAPLAIAVFIWGSIVVVPWVCRLAVNVTRRFSLFFARVLMRKLEPISAARSYTFSGLYAFGFLFLLRLLYTYSALLFTSLVLIGYVIVVLGLSASLIVRLLDSKKIWADVLMKILLFVVPIVATFLAKGYGALWVGEIIRADARNASMAHAAATGFFAVFFVAVLLAFAAIVFEVIFLVALGSSSKKAKRGATGAWKSVRCIFRGCDDWNERIYLKQEARRWGLRILLLCTFISCIVAFSASTWTVAKFGRIALSAAVFEFDAAPADRCELTSNEKTLSEFSVVKALFLNGQQEKAILLERGGNLLEPVALKKLQGEVPDTRVLRLGRVVACYKTDGVAEIEQGKKTAQQRPALTIRP
ncbi:MAG: hypothetical protein ACN6PJ_28285 [Achromobacter sp.]|uniref:hypothetical protein n=1 Tax=Achromobacter sp. TaxID=134375 RepID=UPI003D06211B